MQKYFQRKRWCIFFFVLGVMFLGGCEMTVDGGTVRDYFGATLEADLAGAAAKGRTGEIDRLIKVGVNVNAIGRKNMTPLMWAFAANNVEGMRALLKAGADPNQKIGPEKNLHPVWSAAGMDDSRRLRLLLEYKGDPNAKGVGSRFNALMYGISNFDNVRLLVEAGADVNATNEVGRNAALTAAGLARFDVVIYLLEHGFHYNLPLIAWEVNDLPLSPEREADRKNVLSVLANLGVTPPPGKAPPRQPGL